MKKVVSLGIELDKDAKSRIEKRGGAVVSCDIPTSVDDLLEKTKDADVIYSDGDFLLESLSRLKNVFVTYPYIELGEFDSAELEKNGVYVANARGGNKNSIVEWTVFMALALFRGFLNKVRITESVPFERLKSLEGKKVLIVGHGDIGSEIGKRLAEFGMKVNFYNRGDDLMQKAKDADLVVNALNVNVTDKNLLDKKFFADLKSGAYFISFSRLWTYDLDGLIAAINSGVVAGAAIDCDPEASGDTENEFYQKAFSNEKILVTPHIAFATDVASQNGGEICVQNIEAWLSGKPVNIVKK
ncbi:NAD-binding protein [Candidatus Saccharibacteria bacterium]|nr:NAD-binding protein [Candidatus Saccharibacteria bacterium]